MIVAIARHDKERCVFPPTGPMDGEVDLCCSSEVADECQTSECWKIHRLSQQKCPHGKKCSKLLESGCSDWHDKRSCRTWISQKQYSHLPCLVRYEGLKFMKNRLRPIECYEYTDLLEWEKNFPQCCDVMGILNEIRIQL